MLFTLLHCMHGKTVIHHCFDFDGDYRRVLFPLVAERFGTEHYSCEPNCTAFQYPLPIFTHCPCDLSLPDLWYCVQQQIFHIPPCSTGTSPRTFSRGSARFIRVHRLMLTFRCSKLAFSAAPGSLVSATLGVVAGQLYRSDLFNLKRYQLPPWLIRLSSNIAPYVIGSTRPPRRTNRALHEASRTSFASMLRASAGGAGDEDEGPITTARQSTSSVTRLSAGGRGDNPRGGVTTSVMRDWVNELTGRDGTSPRLRMPSEPEISQVLAMFPNVGRETVVGALQRRCVPGLLLLLAILREASKNLVWVTKSATRLPLSLHTYFSQFYNVPRRLLIANFTRVIKNPRLALPALPQRVPSRPS